MFVAMVLTSTTNMISPQQVATFSRSLSQHSNFHTNTRHFLILYTDGHQHIYEMTILLHHDEDVRLGTRTSLSNFPRFLLHTQGFTFVVSWNLDYCLALFASSLS